MANFVNYYRVSTKAQQSTHLGLDAQKASINRYVESVNGNVVAEFEEVESGKSKEKISIHHKLSIESLLSNRPKLLEAIKYCNINNATLLVKEPERLSRHSLLIDFLINSGVSFICTDCPNDSALIIRIKVAIGEDFLRQVSERTSLALQERKKQIKENGFFISKIGVKHTKLGNDNLPKIKTATKFPSPVYTKAFGYAKSLHNNGLPIADIASILAKEGYSSPSGKPFAPYNVYRMFSYNNYSI